MKNDAAAKAQTPHDKIEARIEEIAALDEPEAAEELLRIAFKNRTYAPAVIEKLAVRRDSRSRDQFTTRGMARLAVHFPEVAADCIRGLNRIGGAAGHNALVELQTQIVTGDTFKAGHIHALLDVREDFKSAGARLKVQKFEFMVKGALNERRMDGIMDGKGRPSADDLTGITKRLAADPDQAFEGMDAMMQGYIQKAAPVAP